MHIYLSMRILDYQRKRTMDAIRRTELEYETVAAIYGNASSSGALHWDRASSFLEAAVLRYIPALFRTTAE